MYQSPIELTIRDNFVAEIEDGVYKAVIKYDIHVDLDELRRALKYDRGQYELGYAIGQRNAAPKNSEWERFYWPSGTHGIRCKACKAVSGGKTSFCPHCGAKMKKEGEP